MSHYSLDGRLPQSMAEDAWLAPTAQVIGDVVLGREASIWFAAIVRGDNEPIVIGKASYACLDVFLATAGMARLGSLRHRSDSFRSRSVNWRALEVRARTVCVKASGRRPKVRAATFVRAGIRNPSHKQTSRLSRYASH
jgi:hypothetical protein